MEEILKVSNLSKGFPGVQALSNVDFTLNRGEILGLMGENGAGKSTLIKVMTGFYRRDSGDIHFDGQAVDFTSPNDAVRHGISTVYQEVNLLPQLTVAENIFIGRQPMKKRGGIDWRELNSRAEDAVAKLDLDIDVTRPLNTYSVAVQQMVSIARALDISAKVLILDEPTSSLDAAEVEQLFTVMRRLKSEGISIVFITHFLDQVFAITDRITVLRSGKNAGEFTTEGLSRMDLISSMLGKEFEDLDASRWGSSLGTGEGDPLVSMNSVGKKGFIFPFDLTIRPGEVLGLAGLLGSGRTEIAQLLYGVEKPDEGVLQLNGQETALSSPRGAIDEGMGFCPEDRKEVGIIPELSVRENIILALQAKRGALRYIHRKEQEAIADKFIRALNIVTPSSDQLVKNLSGGNQQKVILARWLAAEPRLLILDEPTRGIDIGSKVEIQKLILELAKEGLALLFISSELDEVVRCSSRVAVLRDRQVIGELDGTDISESQIMKTIAETA